MKHLTPRTFKRAQGFTLVEMIVAIVVAGIVVALSGMFVRNSVLSYTDSAQRADMVDTADTALRRISRDLHRALPNSVRVPGSQQCLEFIPTTTGGRYRNAAPNNVDFTTTINSFEYFGTLNPTPAPGDRVVIYNLGIPGADAYSGSNMATISAINTGTNTITLSAATAFPYESPSMRFQTVPDSEKAVFYTCSGGTLYRYSNYGFNAATPASCPTPPPSTPVLATNVSSCAFSYAPGFTQRNGLVTLRLGITKNGETVTLYHEVHVNNVP